MKYFTPLPAVRKIAKKGLELRKKYKRGGLSSRQAHKEGIGSGVVRAVNLSRTRVSYTTIKRMHNFFSRHSAFKKFHKDKTSSAYISWLLWGGDPGKKWADSIVKREDKSMITRKRLIKRK